MKPSLWERYLLKVAMVCLKLLNKKFEKRGIDIVISLVFSINPLAPEKITRKFKVIKDE